jgi:hypothetical protein
MKSKNIFLCFLIVVLTSACKEKSKKSDYLTIFTDNKTHAQGYKNEKGEIVISSSKYDYCFTDTFKTFAIVAKPKIGIVAIDRIENVLYEVFNFDNGPDEPVHGLFRIIKNNKIGFADIKTGKIMIEPKYECAYQFENGKAKVSIQCTKIPEEEFEIWNSNNWYYIDFKGNKLK